MWVSLVIPPIDLMAENQSGTRRTSISPVRKAATEQHADLGPADVQLGGELPALPIAVAIHRDEDSRECDPRAATTEYTDALHVLPAARLSEPIGQEMIF